MALRMTMIAPPRTAATTMDTLSPFSCVNMVASVGNEHHRFSQPKDATNDHDQWPTTNTCCSSLRKQDVAHLTLSPEGVCVLRGTGCQQQYATRSRSASPPDLCYVHHVMSRERLGLRHGVLQAGVATWACLWQLQHDRNTRHHDPCAPSCAPWPWLLDARPETRQTRPAHQHKT